MSTMQNDSMLARRRDAARILACSESQILVYERTGVLHRVSLPNVGERVVRSARYSVEGVRALAKRLIDEARGAGTTEQISA